MAITTNGLQLARIAGAVFNQQLSASDYSEILAANKTATELAAWANEAVAAEFRNKTTTDIAKAVLANVGLSSVVGLEAWVAGQLNAGGGVAKAGATMLAMLNDFSNMTADATYGAAASTFNQKAANSQALSQTAGTPTGTYAAVSQVSAGKTFTLTTSVTETSGTDGNDTFTGFVDAGSTATTTLNSGDKIVGGGGSVDSLNISISGTAGTTSVVGVTASSVERIQVQNVSSAGQTFDTVLTSGATTLSSYGSAQAVTFSNISALTGAEMAYGSSNLTMTYATSVVAGSSDAQSLTLSGQTGGTFAAVGIETVNVTASGAAVGTSITAPVTIDNTNTVKTLNISGDQTSWIALTDNSATVVDASKATGRIGIDISASVGNKDVSITGGTANDTFTVGTLGTADSLDGGTGTDTVVVNASTGATALTNVKNVETVELRINGTTSAADVVASIISDVTAHRAALTDSASGGGDVDVTFSKFSDTGSLTVTGSTATGAAAPTNTITVTHATNTASNVFNVTLAGIGNAATTGLENLKADNAETINLTVGANSTGSVTANYIATLESANATTLTLTGDNTLQVGALSGANLKTVNASAMTKGLVLTDGGAVARTITLGSAADLIIAGSAADTITSGDGNDVIVSGGGNDVINGGTGNDTIHVGTVAAPAVGSTAATAVTVTYSSSEQRASIAGGDGNDSIVIDNTALTFRTTVVGGDGTDTMTIRSNVTGTTTIAADGGSTTPFLNISGVENIRLREVDAGNDNLILTINDAALTTTFAGSVSVQAQGDAAGDVVRVDASGVLGASGTIRMSAATDNVGILEMIGGASTEVFTGGTIADTVTYNNSIYLTGTDTLAGGSGSDVLIISSANAAVVAAAQLAGVSSFENINLDGGAGAAATAMRLTLTEAVATANAESSTNLLTVNRAQTGGTIDDTGTTRIDASALTATNVALTGALGADTLTGGAGNDVITGGTGIDSLTGGAGNDRFQYSAASDITAGEVISGGDGTDTIRISGTTDSAAFDFSGATITSIDVLDLIHDAATGGSVATATFGAAAISATTLITESTATDDETTVVINTAAGTNDFSGLTFGSTRVKGITATNAGSNSALASNITGTTLPDILTGGSNSDTISGGLGADTITGGYGTDQILLSESTASVDVVRFAEYGSLAVDTVIGATAGSDIVSISIGNLTPSSGGTAYTFATTSGADRAAAIAAGNFGILSQAVDTADTTSNSTTHDLIFLASTSATSFATAIGTGTIVTDDADAGGDTELANTEGVVTVFYDSTNLQAVFGLLVNTSVVATDRLSSADTFVEIVRVGMTSANYTSANIDAMVAGF